MNYRDKAISEKGEQCVECGAVDDIEVHHRNGDRGDNSLDNLVPLCPDCHGAKHEGEDDSMVNVTIRLPSSVLRELDNEAESRGISRSELIRSKLWSDNEEADNVELARLQSRLNAKDAEIDNLLELVSEAIHHQAD